MWIERKDSSARHNPLPPLLTSLLYWHYLYGCLATLAYWSRLLGISTSAWKSCSSTCSINLGKGPTLKGDTEPCGSESARIIKTSIRSRVLISHPMPIANLLKSSPRVFVQISDSQWHCDSVGDVNSLSFICVSNSTMQMNKMRLFFSGKWQRNDLISYFEEKRER